MAFRGIYDGSVEIGQNREARSAQMEMQRRQIAAQMAMQQQQLQASMAERGMQLQASTQQANADRALKAQGMQAEIGLGQQKLDLGQQGQDLEQQKFDSGASLREMQQANAKLLLQQAQQDFEADQAQRAAQTQFRQSAFGAGLLTAMMNGVTPTSTLSKINQANGVADGDPGSIVGMGGGPEGAWYDVVAQDEQGQIGKKRQEVDPMALLTVAHSILGKDGAKDWVQMFRTRDTNNTRMGLSADAFLKAMAQEDAKTARASMTEGMKTERAVVVEDMKTDRATTLQTLKQQAEKATGMSYAKTDPNKMAKDLTEQLDKMDFTIARAKKNKQEPPADILAERELVRQALHNIRAYMADASTPAGGAAAPVAEAANSASVSGTSVTITIDGQTKTVEDSPALRDWLAGKGISIK